MGNYRNNNGNYIMRNSWLNFSYCCSYKNFSNFQRTSCLAKCTVSKKSFLPQSICQTYASIASYNRFSDKW